MFSHIPIPQELAENEIAPHCDAKRLATLVRLSKPMQTLFQKPLLAAKLLHFIKRANYIGIKKILTDHPQTIFQSISHEKADGTYETISPLRYAFKIYDTYTWKMFYEKIKNNATDVNRFLKQASEQTEHINLAPLFTASEAYIEQCRLYEGNLTAYSAVRLAILNIGKIQHKIVPRHMSIQFCLKGLYSVNPPDFDHLCDPLVAANDLIVENYSDNTKRSFTSLFPELGVNIVLMAGTLNHALYLDTTLTKSFSTFHVKIALDIENFQRVLKARAAELTAQLSELKNTGPVNKMK